MWRNLLLVSVLMAVNVSAAPLELVSNGSAGTVAGNSSAPQLSQDGRYVLFTSSADLIPGVGNPCQNLFLRDLETGAVELVSVSTNGARGNGNSFPGGMSADNRYVVFESAATDLTPEDTNFYSDIFIRDRLNGIIALINRPPDCSFESFGHARNPHISADGAAVAFHWDDTNPFTVFTGRGNLYIWNRSDQSVRLLMPGNATVTGAMIDDFWMAETGHKIVFSVSGINLPANQRGPGEIYLAERTNSVEWPLRSIRDRLQSVGTFENSSVFGPVLSGNGRYLFFHAAPALAISASLLRLDLANDSLLVITNNVDTNLNTEFFGPAVSIDGEFAAFLMRTNIIRWGSSTGFQNVTPEGVSALLPAISGDGRFVAYKSASAVVGPANGDAQIYCRDMDSDLTVLVSRNSAGGGVTDPGQGDLQFSRDGKNLVFETAASGLVAGDTNNSLDIYLWKRAQNELEVISRRAPGAALSPTGFTTLGSASADGRYVALRTTAALSVNDTNIESDIYVIDRVARTNILVSCYTNGMAAGLCGNVLISSDGTSVAFECLRTNLTSQGPSRLVRTLYLKNIATGAITNLTRSNASDISLLTGSADLNSVYFLATIATIRGLYRFDASTGTSLQLVSPQGGVPAVSRDGSLAVYRTETTSSGSKVTLRYFSGTPSTFLALGSLPTLSEDSSTLVTVNGQRLWITNLLTGYTNSFPAAARQPSVSGDGRYIVYGRDNGVTGRHKYDIYLFDQVANSHRLVSHVPGEEFAGSGSSEDAIITRNGRWVAFESYATNLVANDFNSQKDIFLYSVDTGEITLASRNFNENKAGENGSLNPMLTRDDSKLLFISFAADLVEGDFNEGSDLFMFSIPPSTLDLSVARRGAENSIAISWQSRSGVRYQLESTASLNPVDWKPAGNEVLGDGNSMQLTNVIATDGRFFRIRQLD